jgi:hypothetical protein
MTRIILGLLLSALAFALILTANPAHAQVLPFALPSCAPESIGGQGKGLRAFKGMYGSCYGWWCPAGAGWSGFTHCRVTGVQGKPFSDAHDAELVAAPNSLEALQWMIYATEVTPTGDDVARYNALHVAAQADLLTSKPVTVWVVDVGTDTAKLTRPAFQLVNGVRATTSTARATSGQPCKPEVAQAPSLTAGTIWAAFGPNYSAALVALCRAAK